MKKSKRGLSLCMLIASMLIFGTVGICRKYISVGSLTLAWIRGLVGAVFLALFCAIRGKKLFRSVSGSRMLWLLLSGAAIGLNWYLLFESFSYTTVSVGTLVYYMEPTLVILLSALFLKERLTGRKILCMLAALVGMVLVSGVLEGSLPQNGTRGILLAFGAALLYTCVVLLNKKIKGVDAYDKTILQMAAASIVLLPLILTNLLQNGISVFPTTPKEILLSVGMGIVHTGIAYALYFGSMDGLEARTVALFSYIDPVTALLLSAAVLGEKMTVWGIVGAVLIIGAALLSEILPDRKRKGTG